MTKHHPHSSQHPHAHSHGAGFTNSPGHRPLQLLAWETTRACTLSCSHCRAAAQECRDPEELSTQEGIRLLQQAASAGPHVIAILSGGEPLLRPDLEELVAAGTAAKMTVVISGNDGLLLTDQRIASLKKAGAKRFSFSIHSDLESEHDTFVGRPGTLSQAIAAFDRLKKAGVEFQINTTVLPHNLDRLAKIQERVLSWGAAAWHLFFTVPTGRALSLGGSELTDEQTERALEWIAEAQDLEKIPMKVTCAPQYARVRAKMGKSPAGHARGCMAGDGFTFVSWRGDVKPCGYFDLIAGNVREKSFAEIYRESDLLASVRDLDGLTGACGSCGFKSRCGGCRARGFARTGDVRAADPSCLLVRSKPAQAQVKADPEHSSDQSSNRVGCHMDEKDQEILRLLQQGLPLVAEPFKAIGDKLWIDEMSVISRLARMRQEGIIRHIGAFLDSKKLGRKGALVAMQIDEAHIDEVAKTALEIPEITHNYLRDGNPNLWFTVIAKDEAERDAILARMSQAAGGAKPRVFSATRVFKVRVNLE